MSIEYTVNKTDLESVADAIRGKSGTSEKITFPNRFVDGINAIETSGGGDSEADVIVAGFIDGSLSGDIYNDKATRMRGYVLYMLSGITNVNLPNATTMERYAIAYCSNVVEISLANCSQIPSYGCAYNSKLERLYLNSATRIDSRAFYECPNLKTLIIGTNSTSVCLCTNSDAFSATPIADGTGFIFVPDDLVERYKVATNWATYASQIKGISEYEG